MTSTRGAAGNARNGPRGSPRHHANAAPRNVGKRALRRRPGSAHLAQAYRTMTMDQTKPGYPSVISQLAGAVGGRGCFYCVTMSVLAVLCRIRGDWPPARHVGEHLFAYASVSARSPGAPTTRNLARLRRRHGNANLPGTGTSNECDAVIIVSNLYRLGAKDAGSHVFLPPIHCRSVPGVISSNPCL